MRLCACELADTRRFMSKERLHISVNSAHRIYTRLAISIIYSQAEHFEAHQIIHTCENLCADFFSFCMCNTFVGSKPTDKTTITRDETWTFVQPLYAAIKQIEPEKRAIVYSLFVVRRTHILTESHSKLPHERTLAKGSEDRQSSKRI